MDPYAYSPLPDANGTRFLRLLPGSHEAEIDCDLFPVDFHQLFPVYSKYGEYEALSYVWGDKSVRKNIIVNGRSLGITTNLHAALLRLRYRSTSRLLWIDAICINQTDIEERAAQVERMATIYALAECVLVWLGPEQNRSNHAFNLIRKAAQTRGTGGEVLESSAIGNFSDLQMVGTSKPGIFSDAGALHRLLSRAWFSRIWVSGTYIIRDI
jgi:hypothetical protein